jgi:2,4-dienoyl-CoA reductase-like NADH-dependent reductase (Old Yellow Enzyme family)
MACVVRWSFVVFLSTQLRASDRTQQKMALFQSAKIGDIEVKNRFVMAPLTRCRATPRTHLPTPIMAEYYAQRAGAGLIVSEATMIDGSQSAAYAEPGIYNEAQVEAWKPITAAVHAKGGKIVCQLWHAGRACHSANGPHSDATKNVSPVAPSAIGIEGHQLSGEMNPTGEKIDYEVPRALTDEEIPSIVAAFA